MRIHQPSGSQDVVIQLDGVCTDEFELFATTDGTPPQPGAEDQRVTVTCMPNSPGCSQAKLTLIEGQTHVQALATLASHPPAVAEAWISMGPTDQALACCQKNALADLTSDQQQWLKSHVADREWSSLLADQTSLSVPVEAARRAIWEKFRTATCDIEERVAEVFVNHVRFPTRGLVSVYVGKYLGDSELEW